MRPFEHFPKESVCKLCGTNDDKECTLIPIDGTGDGRICEAVPTHCECIKNISIRYNKDVNIFYVVAVK